jgi:hypothetical protein
LPADPRSDQVQLAVCAQPLAVHVDMNLKP